MAAPQRALFLVLDGAPEIRELLRELLTTKGYRVLSAESLPQVPHEVAEF